ncbi:hypothetical protein HQ533_04040 [Candidatus Woesearchaeota archaeon]|nr:hypothetical protein [Candidatus Woesearchaeota archaeon]
MPTGNGVTLRDMKIVEETGIHPITAMNKELHYQTINHAVIILQEIGNSPYIGRDRMLSALSQLQESREYGALVNNASLNDYINQAIPRIESALQAISPEGHEFEPEAMGHFADTAITHIQGAIYHLNQGYETLEQRMN